MTTWLEAIGALMVGATEVAIGKWFARRKDWKWVLGYFIPLGVIGVVALGRHLPEVELMPPICWLTLGRGKFALIGLVSAVVLATPAFRLPRLRDRNAVMALITTIVLGVAVWPYASTALVQHQLRSLPTRVDQDGVCLQNTPYTCGPAAAATALRRLGLPADESELAILAFTSPAIGTTPDILAQTLRKRYRADGLAVSLRSFKNTDELRTAGPTLAVVKFSLLIDHYVTVLEVTETHVIVGDPLIGLTKLSREEFDRRWRQIGIVLRRTEPKEQ